MVNYPSIILITLCFSIISGNVIRNEEDWKEYMNKKWPKTTGDNAGQRVIPPKPKKEFKTTVNRQYESVVMGSAVSTLLLIVFMWAFYQLYCHFGDELTTPWSPKHELPHAHHQPRRRRQPLFMKRFSSIFSGGSDSDSPDAMSIDSRQLSSASQFVVVVTSPETEHPLSNTRSPTR